MIEASTSQISTADRAMHTSRAVGGVGNGRRQTRRVELSDVLRCYLRSKYLEAGCDAQSPEPVHSIRFGNPQSAVVPTHRMRRPIGLVANLKTLALGIAIVPGALFAFAAPAHASSLVLAQTGLVIGTQTAEYSINIPSSGTLDLQLQDFDWPSPMTSVTLEIASPTTMLQTLSGTGDLNLSLSSAGTYYAYVSGTATGNLDIGAFGLLGNFEPLVAPVPLPASVTLLFGGLAAMLWALRRDNRKGGLIIATAG